LMNSLCKASIIFFFARGALAEPSPGTSAMAEALFDRARTELLAESYDVACDRLAASFALERVPGTLLNLGVCHELQGKLATAWSDYKELLTLSDAERGAERKLFAAQRIRILEDKLCRVTVAPTNSARTLGVELSVNGIVLAPAAWYVNLPWDPGVYQVSARAAGYEEYVGQVTVRECPASYTVQIPKLKRRRLPRRPVAAMVTPRTSPLAHTIGLAAGATGLALLGLGAYWGVRTMDSWADRNRHCVGETCDAVAVESYHDAKRFSALATARLAFGVPLVGGGVFLIVSSPGRQPARTAARIQPIALGFRWQF
jgi:hypothetical protein